MTKTHLVVQEPLLHAVVGADLLQDVPGKLSVQLIRNGAHDNGDHADDGGHGNEEGFDQQPHVLVLVVRLQSAGVHELVDRAVNLINLEGGVDEDGQVGHAQADDLNRVLEAQGVPCQEQDVEEAEDEEGQEGRYRAVLRLGAVGEALFALEHETELEPREHVSAALSRQHRGWP